MAHELYIAETFLIVGPLVGVTSHALFIAVGPSEKKWLVGLEHAAASGSGTIRLERKTRNQSVFSAVSGMSGLATSTTVTLTTCATPIGVYDGDRFRIVFSETGTIDGWDGALRFKCRTHDSEHGS
jgi:hypothetical protein